MTVVDTQAKIFTCTQSKVLAQKIADAFGISMGNVITSTYSDGEFQPSYEESIRGARVFIIGSTHPGPENLMEMLLMIDAASFMDIVGGLSLTMRRRPLTKKVLVLVEDDWERSVIIVEGGLKEKLTKKEQKRNLLSFREL